MGARLAAARAVVADRWLELPPWRRVHVLSLMLAVVGFLAHYVIAFCWIQPWYIEDSAISFAYARHFVDGDGLVPYVGGERVEGYSNPTWTALLAACYAVGIGPWTASKVLGAVFGSIGLVGTYGVVVRARGDRPADPAPALAPWLLAASTQYVIWAASGLENGLFCALLACGTWQLCREVEDGRRAPWSALLFFLLAVTRPDGLIYAGLALLARVAGAVAYRQPLALLYWMGAISLPLVAYHAARYEYFGWAWPNTWYAKEKAFRPFDWTGAGWKQVKDYMWNYGIVFALPLLGFGLLGLKDRRRWLLLPAFVVLALAIAWDPRDGIPAGWQSSATRALGRAWPKVRVYAILATAIVLGLATLRGRGWVGRGLLWASYCSGIFFVLLAGGDWMKGYRWFSLCAVPQFAILAMGLAELVEGLPGAGRRVWNRVPFTALYALAPMLALMGTNMPRTRALVLKPETAPKDVHKRVNYMGWVQKRLELERVRLFDVDMGAHLWYTDWEIADIAGLVDVTMAHHDYEKRFLEEYIYEERDPEFAHLHGAWANKVKLSKDDRWDEEYVEIPGYPSGGKSLHVGNHVRKDILVHPAPPEEPAPRARFAGGIALHALRVPSPEVAAGEAMYVESRWSGEARPDGWRVVLFLAAADGSVPWSAEVVPGYDWYDQEHWRAAERVDGNWAVGLPKQLPEGEYRLGVVLLDEDAGTVLAPEGAEPGAEEPGAEEPAAPALFAAGEWLTGDLVRVVPRARAVAEAEADLAAALDAAGRGDCEVATTRWRDAVHHLSPEDRWVESSAAAIDGARARCLVARARAADDPLDQADALRAARRWDPRDADLAEACGPIGASLEALGDAKAGKDAEAAYRYYNASAWADPRRVQARKKAEEQRTLRLKLKPQADAGSATAEKLRGLFNRLRSDSGGDGA